MAVASDNLSAVEMQMSEDKTEEVSQLVGETSNCQILQSILKDDISPVNCTALEYTVAVLETSNEDNMDEDLAAVELHMSQYKDRSEVVSQSAEGSTETSDWQIIPNDGDCDISPENCTDLESATTTLDTTSALETLTNDP